MSVTEPTNTESAAAGTGALQSYPNTAPQPHGLGAPQAPLSSVGRLIGAALLDAVLSAVTFGIGWLIWACITASEGRTPGKKLMGMQVVDATSGQPMTWGSYVFMRGLVGGTVQGLAGMVTLGILHLMPLWDARNQSIAAKVSNSVVVDRAA